MVPIRSTPKWSRTLIFMRKHPESSEMGSFTNTDVTRVTKVYEDPKTKWVQKGIWINQVSSAAK